MYRLLCAFLWLSILLTYFLFMCLHLLHICKEQLPSNWCRCLYITNNTRIDYIAMKPKASCEYTHNLKWGHCIQVSKQHKQFFETFLEHGIICNKCSQQQFCRKFTNCVDTNTDILTTVPAPVRHQKMK